MNKRKTLRFETPEDIQRAFERDPRSMYILMGLSPEPTKEELEDYYRTVKKLIKAIGIKSTMSTRGGSSAGV